MEKLIKVFKESIAPMIMGCCVIFSVFLAYNNRMILLEEQLKDNSRRISHIEKDIENQFSQLAELKIQGAMFEGKIDSLKLGIDNITKLLENKYNFQRHPY